jgi:hypothetical protein
MVYENSDFLQKTSAELDAALSELEFEILFLKCQIVADSPSRHLSVLSDVNDELTSLEIKAQEIEDELKRRGDSRDRKSLADMDSSLAVETLLRTLPKSRSK